MENTDNSNTKKTDSINEMDQDEGSMNNGVIGGSLDIKSSNDKEVKSDTVAVSDNSSKAGSISGTTDNEDTTGTKS